MRFWDYVSEFIFFRWLFGSHKHNEKTQDITDTTSSQVATDLANDTDSLSDDECHDDELKAIKKRTIKKKKKKARQQRARQYINRSALLSNYEYENHDQNTHDYDSDYYYNQKRSYNQSIDDFLDEQEEYDMLDDIF